MCAEFRLIPLVIFSINQLGRRNVIVRGLESASPPTWCHGCRTKLLNEELLETGKYCLRLEAIKLSDRNTQRNRQFQQEILALPGHVLCISQEKLFQIF